MYPNSNPIHQEDKMNYFQPPLWRQRRAMIYGYLQKFKSQIIMDLGCGEGNVLNYLIPCNDEVECTQIIGIDVNSDHLDECAQRCQPNSMDQNQLRERPLNVQFYLGNLSIYDSAISQVDTIIFSEVVEHLHPQELQEAPKVIFGGYRPKHVIISTPNAEFNVLFPELNYRQPDQIFRDSDHKFEWIREEFNDWCQSIAQIYGYNFELNGVGSNADSQRLNLGYCTQFAVFDLDPNFNNEYPTPTIGNYHLTVNIDYPYYQITHSIEEAHQILLNQLKYLDKNDGRFELQEVWNILPVRQAFKYYKNFLDYLNSCPLFELDEPTFYLNTQETTQGYVVNSEEELFRKKSKRIDD